MDTWDEVEFVLQDLISGKDKLKEKRLQLIDSCYYINENGAGNEIKEIIKKDARQNYY